MLMTKTLKAMNRKVLFGILAATALLLCPSCGDGKYEVSGDVVCYTYWTFSFGQRYDTLPEVDAKTFEQVKNWLGRDASHVYYEDRLIQGADPATLKAHRKPLCSDRKDYYYQGVPLHVADMKNFKVLKNNTYGLWAKDSRYVYRDSDRIEVDDVEAFHVVDWNVATDNVRVYFFGSLLADSDPKTFEYLDDLYAKDKSHVWYMDEVVEGADPATFTVDKEGNASDKNGKYYRGKRAEEP